MRVTKGTEVGGDKEGLGLPHWVVKGNVVLSTITSHKSLCFLSLSIGFFSLCEI